MSRLEELNSLCEDPELWSDSAKAQSIMKERTRLDQKIQAVREIKGDAREHVEMIELGELEGDAGIVAEAEKALNAVKVKAARQQLQCLLSGEMDECDAYFQVNAGSGGTEAQDWAAMLLRMYLRWADARGFKTEIMERSNGEEAGIKSVSVKVTGEQVYGWLKTETGVHRLVRISPYDSSARRHTSFSSVSVSPVIDDAIDIQIDEKDLKIDTYRSSGAGGQHVNTTDSAVRITHIPTGIVAACQNQRSQHKNRDEAMQMLKARMYEAEMQERAATAAAEHEEKTDIGWGHQIRSYVLHPYQMVKDLRTGAETTNSAAVLDGDLDMFLEASLSDRLGVQNLDAGRNVDDPV